MGVIDVNVICSISEREWRQKWLIWTKLGAKVSRTLDVGFSEEVGSRRGSWKGGTISTGFNISKSKTIKEGLTAMEKKYDMFSIILQREEKIKKILKREDE